MRSATAPRKRSASISASVSASGSWISSETAMIEAVVAQRQPEGAGLQHEAVIVEADPVGRPAEAVPVEAGIPGGLADRQHHEQREQQQRRRQEQHQDREPAVADRATRQRASGEARRASIDEAARRESAAHRQLPCFQAAWIAFAACLRRHAATGDLGGDVVDDAADRRTEALVVEVLVVVRLRQVVRRCCFMKALLRPASAPLTTGIEEVAGGQPRLHVLGDEELEEVDGLLRRALGDRASR